MSKDRRTLLQLIASGRVTPAEAERILMLWNADRETLWIFAACAALAILGEFHMQGSMQSAHSLFPAVMLALRHAFSWCTHFAGGKQ